MKTEKIQLLTETFEAHAQRTDSDVWASPDFTDTFAKHIVDFQTAPD